MAHYVTEFIMPVKSFVTSVPEDPPVTVEVAPRTRRPSIDLRLPEVAPGAENPDVEPRQDSLLLYPMFY